jgi:pyruvate formate-lyase activating enzyme-like uncharacterized protein
VPIKKWLNGSAYTGRLPKGCVQCARGSKLVLLVTGKCVYGCYYCPLSFKKKGRAVVYADEMRVRKDADILEEAGAINATGTGVTGGDPLIQPNETTRLIKLLKDNFGERHHIHLYTRSTDLKAIEKVASAGLDEIRFHPPTSVWKDLGESEYAGAIVASRGCGMEAGFEIPAIPGCDKDVRTFLNDAYDVGASFVNLNELEFSESNWRALKKRGFDVKDDVSASVKGSQSMAFRLLRSAPAGLPTHYCSSSFKDGIQLRRRIMRRARNVARPLDILTKDGTLIIGIIETRDPLTLAADLRKRFDIPKKYIESNQEMRRVEIASWILEEIAPELKKRAFIIEEYPTADRLEVEREAIGKRS